MLAFLRKITRLFLKRIESLENAVALPILSRAALYRIRRTNIQLQKEHDNAENHHEQNLFALYRILGNDLPPRHRKGQTLANLRFILDHEHEFPGCVKIWILNRIVDSDEKRKIMALLKSRGREYIDIPFNQQEYALAGLNQTDLPPKKYLEQNPGDEWLKLTVESLKLKNKNLYLMNNNRARNRALEHGNRLARWIMPCDGNCFLTTDAWNSISRAVCEKPWMKYFIVPMSRTSRNEDLLESDYRPLANEEPQIIFRNDALEKFNENYPYGTMPKVELLWRLRVPGVWDAWRRIYPWQKRRKKNYSSEQFQFSWCGWVARLDSGNEKAESDLSSRGLERVRGIVDFINAVDASLNTRNIRP